LAPNVRCRTRHGYQREPSTDKAWEIAHVMRKAPESLFPAPLLNARGRWTAHDLGSTGELRAYDAAAIVAGHEVISAYDILWTEDRRSTPVWACVMLDLALPAELALYEALHDAAQGGSSARKPAATLKVGPQTVELEILSEPYVVHGRLGYSAMVTVLVLSTRREMGLYVQASSLASALEAIRHERGRLTGARLRISRESEARYARYIVDDI
jgi:hypothetical protein